jgi:hypothetical protein
MITIETHQYNWKTWRPRVFTFLTVFLSIVLLVAGTFEFIPAWILRNPPDAIHLWHIAELTALSAILLGGVMFGLVRKPEEKPLLAQFIVMSVIILAVGIAPFLMPVAGILFLAGLIVLAYPQPRALLSFSHMGRISVALLAITVLFAVILDPIIQQEIHYQIIGMAEQDAHALQFHWIGSALLYVLLILAGVYKAARLEEAGDRHGYHLHFPGRNSFDCTRLRCWCLESGRWTVRRFLRGAIHSGCAC